MTPDVTPSRGPSVTPSRDVTPPRARNVTPSREQWPAAITRLHSAQTTDVELIINLKNRQGARHVCPAAAARPRRRGDRVRHYNRARVCCGA